MADRPGEYTCASVYGGASSASRRHLRKSTYRIDEYVTCLALYTRAYVCVRARLCLRIRAVCATIHALALSSHSCHDGRTCRVLKCQRLRVYKMRESLSFFACERRWAPVVSFNLISFYYILLSKGSSTQYKT